jgi:hypothetical protein
MARDIATRKVVDFGSLSDAEVIEKAAGRGYPEPPDRLTAEGLLLISEPGALNIELSVPDSFGEQGRIDLANGFLAAQEKATEDAVKAEKKAAKPKPKAKAKPKVKVVVLGNGYYQVGDEKFHGKKALEKAGYEAP